MTFIAYGQGKLARVGAVGTVGVTVFEADPSVIAVVRATAPVKEVVANTGLYVASVTVADPRRVLWMLFDDAAGNHSQPYQCGMIPCEVVAGSLTGTIVDPVPANVLQINGNADSPPRLDRSANTVALGTVHTTPTPTTISIPTTGLVPAAAATDQFKSRILMFSKDTVSVNLRGQFKTILGNTTGGLFTTDPFTHAPVAGDVFAIN